MTVKHEGHYHSDLQVIAEKIYEYALAIGHKTPEVLLNEYVKDQMTITVIVSDSYERKLRGVSYASTALDEILIAGLMRCDMLMGEFFTKH